MVNVAPKWYGGGKAWGLNFAKKSTNAQLRQMKNWRYYSYYVKEIGAAQMKNTHTTNKYI